MESLPSPRNIKNFKIGDGYNIAAIKIPPSQKSRYLGTCGFEGYKNNHHSAFLPIDMLKTVSL